jgi:MoxR-like ATPase
MTARFLTATDEAADDDNDEQLVELSVRRGYHRPAHVLDRRSRLAINAALATGRPLLVRGEPGVGKSQLAHAAARALGRIPLHHAVDARTEPRDLLYTVDAVARLAEAQVIGAIRDGERVDVAAKLAVGNFVHPGVLWWAFDWEGASHQCVRAKGQAQRRPDGLPERASIVLLIDEIDKADSAIPNALLDALGHRSFDVPDCGPVAMKDGAEPLVIITTNEERSLPDAFLRRCFVLHLDLPDDPDGLDTTNVRRALIARGEAHFPDCRPAIRERAAELIAERRLEMRRDRMPAPGVAEYIDLVDAVLAQRGDTDQALALLDEIKPYVLHKHPPPPQARKT